MSKQKSHSASSAAKQVTGNEVSRLMELYVERDQLKKKVSKTESNGNGHTIWHDQLERVEQSIHYLEGDKHGESIE